eukprot:TRINITY_DN3005_c0_g1_i3.p1 TRINITY_DN3005_c0_g1~~TRINITY_DN3005_c0_g1_i3.p1  ORF type:complete len:348 (-),score=62.43 TRINITY_DN3005_c0_g1_i3:419-1462(-)
MSTNGRTFSGLRRWLSKLVNIHATDEGLPSSSFDFHALPGNQVAVGNEMERVEDSVCESPLRPDAVARSCFASSIGHDGQGDRPTELIIEEPQQCLRLSASLEQNDSHRHNNYSPAEEPIIPHPISRTFRRKEEPPVPKLYHSFLAECRICKEEGVAVSCTVPKNSSTLSEEASQQEFHIMNAADIASAMATCPREELMLQPCKCGGTMAKVHLRCLQQWIERRRLDISDPQSLSCEVCKSPYQLQVREELDLSCNRLCAPASLTFYAEVTSILLTLVSLFFLFLLFSVGASKEKEAPLSFVVSMAVVGAVLVFGAFTICKVLLVPLLSPMPSPSSSPLLEQEEEEP